MRLGVVDLSFHWPPTGGSWVEVAEVCRRLPGLGIEVVLVVPKVRTGDMERGLLRSDPGFQVAPVALTEKQFHWRRLPRLLNDALEDLRVDRLWLTNTFGLAPAVMAGLAGWPLVWRVFGYELACPNYMSLHPRASIMRWARENPEGDVCPLSYFRTPARCTLCAIRGMAGAFPRRRRNSYTHEWLSSGAWLPSYAPRCRKAVRSCLGIMCYNEVARTMLQPAARRVRVVPGGVDTVLFHPTSDPPEDTVLMAGRADDPRKGLEIFSRAASRLRRRGWRGRALATTSSAGEVAAGVEGTGWIPYSQMPDLYRRARVVVVPTLWPEPFGLVPLEAMACGRPVVASAIGGLVTTVGNTELTFPPGDAEALSSLVERLLKDTAFWHAKAAQARAVAESFAWDRVIEQHHLCSLAGSASWWDSGAPAILAQPSRAHRDG